MIWNLRTTEFLAVLSLSPEQRYEYFIKRVADEERLWGLWRDDWVFSSENDDVLMAVWPHAKYANAMASGAFADSEAKGIGLEDWMTSWLPRLARNKVLVSVFPSAKDRGLILQPGELAHNLRHELEKYD